MRGEAQDCEASLFGGQRTSRSFFDLEDGIMGGGSGSLIGK